MLPNTESPDPEIFSRMETRLQVKPSERTLKYIADLWRSLSIHFNLPPYQLLLEKILKGSVTITWCFPRYETMRITEMIKSSFQFFSEHDIVDVSINTESVYQAKSDSQLESVAAGSVGDESQVISPPLGEAVELSSSMVSKDYSRLEYLIDKIGEQTLRKFKKAGTTELISASTRGDRMKVQLLLEMGADVNMRDSDGQTAVYIASAEGYCEVVRLLVQAKADLELHTEEDQDTPLTITSDRGHSDVVRVLLEAGANINHQTINQVTPLMLAAREGHTAVVKELLTRQNLNINMRNKDGQTAVYIASAEGHCEVVRLLVQAGVNLELHTEEDQDTPLIISSGGGHSEVVRVLLEAGANVNHQNKWGQTAVYIASAKGHCEVVKLLIKAGADLELHMEEDQATPLFISSLSGHSEVVRVLLEAGANVNHLTVDQVTPLMYAAREGNTAVVKELLTRQDLNINIREKETQATALIISSERGHSEVVRVLLEAGANINHKDMNGETAVYSASAEGQCEVVKVLIQAGADLELQNKEDQATPLIISSFHGHSEVVRVLLEAGASINHQAVDQLTPLMYAAREGHTTVVVELLNRQDININMTDKNGLTAEDLALEEEHSEIVQMIFPIL